MEQQAEKDRKSNRTRQKNKRGDSKVESNDSPEIPDRGVGGGVDNIRHPQPPLRGSKRQITSQKVKLFCRYATATAGK